MKVTRVAPSARLAPFVRGFTLVETTGPHDSLLLPDTGVALALRYRGAAWAEGRSSALPDATLTGLRDTARRIHTACDSGVLVVSFQPTGAAHWFPWALHDVRGEMIACDDAQPRWSLDDVHERLARATTASARVAVVEGFLIEHQHMRVDPLVDAAVGAITQHRGAVRVRELARRLGTSQDPLEKRFRRIVGTTPKSFAGLLRLRRVVEDYRPGVRLASLARDAGYFDEAHLARAFRAATGDPPKRFLTERAFG